MGWAFEWLRRRGGRKHTAMQTVDLRYERDGKALTIRATQVATEQWELALIDDQGHSTQWDELFPSAADAQAEAAIALEVEGIDAFLSPD